MAGLIISNIRAWDDNATPAAAKAMTTSLVAAPAGVMPAVPKANLIRLWVTLDGTAVDGVTVSLTPAKRGTTTTANIEPVRNLQGLAAGVADLQPGSFRASFAPAITGKTVPLDIPIFPGVPYLVSVARVGGAADSTAIVTADFAEV